MSTACAVIPSGPTPLELSKLSSRFAKSGYRNIYESRNGRGKWRVRPKQGDKLLCLPDGRFDDLRDAVHRLVRWYRENYSPDRRSPAWTQMVFGGGVDGRRRNRWGTMRVPTRYDRRGGQKRVAEWGYAVWFWELGRLTMFGEHLSPTDWRKDRKRRRLLVYATREEAQAAFRQWVATTLPRRWGVLAVLGEGLVNAVLFR